MKYWRIHKSPAVAWVALIVASFSFAKGQAPATQPSTAPSGNLQVVGKVPHPLTLSLDQLAALDHVTITLKDRHGQQINYSGIPLEEILKAAGLQFGQMSSARSAAGMCVVVTASDGYKVVFSMAELDSQFQKHLVILVDQENGKPLDAVVGPLRIIAPDEAIHARWIRQVISLTVAEP
jgi:DMSO/TMAO reductase YedYZ molybdopterin-dependent catalytic subunit